MKLNEVIAGDYKGLITYKNAKKGLVITQNGLLTTKKTYINKDTVASYEEVGVEQEKSVASGVAKGIVGGALFGGIGAIAGAASGKTKGTHTVSIQFKDGTKALCEMDNALYKQLVTVLY